MDRRDFIRTGALASVGLAAGLNVAAQPTKQRRRLRVAQIGTAHAHASEKWRTLQNLPDVFEPVALCEPDASRQATVEAKEEYAAAPWVTEREFFALKNIDAVLVETELPHLLEYGERVLSANWHLHLDKPPGRSLAAFEVLQSTAEKAGRVFQQGYMYRYHPAFRFCLDAAHKGWLGKIFAIHGDIGKVISPARRPWLAENYGGSMMLLGCHLLDLTIALMGKPARITSHRRNTFPAKDSFFDHEVAVLEYDDGIATIRSMLAEVEGDDRRQFVVCGENATIEIMPLEPAKLRVAFQKPPADFKSGYQDVALPPVDARYGEQLLDFARLIRGEASVVPLFDAAHERTLHRVLLETSKT